MNKWLKKWKSEPLIISMVSTVVLGAIASILIFRSETVLCLSPIILYLVCFSSLGVGLVHKHFMDKKMSKT